jgi:hypothetical protein
MANNNGQDTGRQPTIALTDLPHLCAVGPRPQILTAIFRKWMISHFKDLANIEHKSLEGYIWRPNIADTGIVITTATQFAPEEAGSRPALVIKRNAWKNIRLGIDNRMFGPSPDGHDYYANYWMGSHTFFCLAGEGAEAEILAAEVFRELNEFAPTLRPNIGLHRLEVVEVGELYLVEESSENFAVPVNIAYAWEEAWQVQTLDTAIIQSVDLSLFSP